MARITTPEPIALDGEYTEFVVTIDTPLTVGDILDLSYESIADWGPASTAPRPSPTAFRNIAAHSQLDGGARAAARR